MPVVVLFIIFVVLLVIAVPVSITLGITSVLPSVFDPSFTVGAKYLIRAMFGGLDSFPLLAVPMCRNRHLPFLRCDLRFCSGNGCCCWKYDDSNLVQSWL